MSGDNDESSDVITVVDLRPLRVVLVKRVAEDVALRRVFVFLPLLSVHLLNRLIGSKLFEDRRFSFYVDV